MKDRTSTVRFTAVHGVARRGKEGLGRIDPVDDVEWLMRCLILNGAARVAVDLDGKEIKALRFQWRPTGPEHVVDYSRPARPYLLITRGGS
jgi:hypothetical protein